MPENVKVTTPYERYILNFVFYQLFKCQYNNSPFLTMARVSEKGPIIMSILLQYSRCKIMPFDLKFVMTAWLINYLCLLEHVHFQ